MNLQRITRIIDDVLAVPFLSPAVDDYATIPDGEITGQYKFAVPGNSKETIRVTKKGQKLLIYVKDKLAKTLFLPLHIDKESIKVVVRDGILTLNYDRNLTEDAEEEVEIK